MQLARTILVAWMCGAVSAAAAWAQDGLPSGTLPAPGFVQPNWSEVAAEAPMASLAPTTGELDSLLPPLVESLPPPTPLDEPPPADAFPTPITPTPHWYHPNYWLGEEPWTAGLELGLNGSEGNNNTFSMRTGGHLKRETPRWKVDSSLVYNKNHNNGVETQNNGKIDVRFDRVLAESQWTLFSLDNLIYDEFQAFDVQLSLNGGVGYRAIDTEIVDLISRLGAGATREFGGPDNDWQPTALMGLDYEHQLTKMQRLTGRVDYYPEWEDFRQYRVVTDVGWQINLDRPKNVSIKVSIIDRYDSTPDGVEPNNLDYAVLLIWGL